jgi:hypothetical protein
VNRCRGALLVLLLRQLLWLEEERAQQPHFSDRPNPAAAVLAAVLVAGQGQPLD